MTGICNTILHNEDFTFIWKNENQYRLVKQVTNDTSSISLGFVSASFSKLVIPLFTRALENAGPKNKHFNIFRNGNKSTHKMCKYVTFLFEIVKDF